MWTHSRSFKTFAVSFLGKFQVFSQPALRNGKVTFDEMMEPFFFVRTRHSGACTEMGLFDMFCVSPGHLRSVDFLRSQVTLSYVPGAVQEWAKLLLAAESNGRYNLLCCLSAVCHAPDHRRSSNLRRQKDTKTYPNLIKALQIVQVCSNHILSCASLGLFEVFQIQVHLEKWWIWLLGINRVYQ